MASLTEILIIRGLMPIESLESGEIDPAAEEIRIRALLKQGFFTEAQVVSARAAQAGLRFVELSDYPVDRAAVSLVAPSLCRRYEVMPIALESDRLVLAMVDPQNVFALDDVRAATGRQIKPVVAERSDLLAALDRFQRADDEMSDLSSAFQEEFAATSLDTTLGDDLSDDIPIVRFVNLMISQAIQDQASDIHVEPTDRELRIRYRIDGVLHEMPSAPKNIQNGVTSRLKIMADIDIAERRRPQDGRLSIEHEGRKVDLRVATLPTVYGEKIVLRILDNASSGMRMEDLDMLARNSEAFKHSYTKPYGMILVTGPTGSGKSTTLYTTLNEIAKPSVNVITVEDPVEYRMPGINQMQVNLKAGLTFPAALRSILRADPDIVLLGEIRDRETAQIAVEASLTGHLVLSTLHTNDAPSAITRLVEMGIEPFLVGSALLSVVAQRLARRLCERCKTGYDHSIDDLHALGFSGATSANPKATALGLYRAVGCVNCSNTGYRGRIALHEVMTVSEEIERLAVSRAPSSDIQKVAVEQGMLTLKADGWAKVQMGLTSVDEIMRVVA